MSIRKLLPYLIFAGVLAGAAVLLRPDPPPPAEPVPGAEGRAAPGGGELPPAVGESDVAAGGSAPAGDLAGLESRLEREIAARRALERQIDALARELAELRASVGADAPAADEPLGEVDPESADDDPLERREWFDEQALLDAGIDALEAETLRRFYEALELERLTLRDQARREDWSDAELRTAMQTLSNREAELSQRLGDAAYDAYLYAAGRPNRLVVTSVLASAQAGQAGIVSGDRILRYDNRRIYNWRDLREAMSGGSITDTIAVEVERDGDTLQFYLARGPLGVRTDSRSIAP